MKFQRSLKSEVHIDLTSLIDVVFLLLIFFMLTTTFIKDSNLIVSLPEANGQMAEDDGALRIDILITSEGSYSVNGQTLGNTEIDTLVQAIEELSAGDNTLPITITADADTTHQSVVTAMDAVARLGFSRLSIATRQTAEAAAE